MPPSHPTSRAKQHHCIKTNHGGACLHGCTTPWSVYVDSVGFNGMLESYDHLPSRVSAACACLFDAPFDMSTKCTDKVKLPPPKVARTVDVPSPSAAGGNTTVAIVVDGIDANTTQNYTYSEDLTPVVASVSPTSASTTVTNVFTLSGTGFLPNGGAYEVGSHRVTFEGRECEIDNVTDSTIVCTLLRGEAFETSLAAPKGKATVCYTWLFYLSEKRYRNSSF